VLLGFDLHSWEQLMLLSLGIAGLAAIAVFVATASVVILQRDENAKTQREFEEYKLEAGAQISQANAQAEQARADAAGSMASAADAQSRAERAREDAAKANERAAQLEKDAEVARKETAQANARIAELNNETERLRGDNLALQSVLLPRHVGLIGLDQEPPAKKWFAGFEQWAETKILIQAIPGDPEAKNLANEIAIVLSKFGWHPEMIDEKRSGISLNLHEGLNVFSPGSYKAWDPTDSSQQLFAKLGNAAVALARALTSAGLGIGAFPVSGVHGSIIVVDFPADSEAAQNQYGRFDPPLDGVYLQVGARPIGLTMDWIRRGRPDPLGNKANP
jgi:hypothetical protein